MRMVTHQLFNSSVYTRTQFIVVGVQTKTFMLVYFLSEKARAQKGALHLLWLKIVFSEMVKSTSPPFAKKNKLFIHCGTKFTLTHELWPSLSSADRPMEHVWFLIRFLGMISCGWNCFLHFVPWVQGSKDYLFALKNGAKLYAWKDFDHILKLQLLLTENKFRSST